MNQNDMIFLGNITFRLIDIISQKFNSKNYLIQKNLRKFNSKNYSIKKISKKFNSKNYSIQKMGKY